jgi:CheY-like chemotaxis protein
LRQKKIATPIVALTAYAMKGDDKKCLDAGCDDYLCKPIVRKQLLEVLGRHLTKSTEPSNDSRELVESEAR